MTSEKKIICIRCNCTNEATIHYCVDHSPYQRECELKAEIAKLKEKRTDAPCEECKEFRLQIATHTSYMAAANNEINRVSRENLKLTYDITTLKLQQKAELLQKDLQLHKHVEMQQTLLLKLLCEKIEATEKISGEVSNPV